MASILIVEEHPLVAEATMTLLSKSTASLRFVVCSDARQATEHFDDSHEDWFKILLDLDVPGAYGLSLTKEVSRRGMQRKCCVLTALYNLDFISALKAEGFLGYIVKATPIDEFTQGIANILQGDSVFSQTPPGSKTTSVRITRRQTELLECVGRGMLSKQIADALCLSEGTVNNQINSTLKTLKVATRAQAVSRAIELGLLRINDS